jgi:hypothetical protein
MLSTAKKEGMICHSNICMSHDDWIGSVAVLAILGVVMLPVLFYIFM